MKKRLSSEPYKGVRDFFPADLRVREYIFEMWSQVVESFGYERYDASVLEPAELFRAKSGEEIVNEQTYTFTDRGEREVTLRPEMTPTVARMIAAQRRDLAFPVRWYSIPNLFRYERPQRGRLREHWQLNCDLFGADTIDADVEILLLADALMREFGAREKDFEIRICDRAWLNDVFKEYGLDEEQTHRMFKLLDRKDKIDDFDEQAQAIVGTSFDMNSLTPPSDSRLSLLKERLAELGVTAVIDPSIVRGFDYYTNVVFEVFDTAKENNRALFGGGRYDGLTELFGGDRISAIGFGVGDVTFVDFLKTHDLLPELPERTDLFIGTHKAEHIPYAQKLATKLRDEGLHVIVNVTEKKMKDQLSFANKKRIPFVIVIGDDEVAHEQYPMKHMETGTEVEVQTSTITETIDNWQ